MMPIHLEPLTRRRFLAGSVVGALSLSSGAWASGKTDPDRFAWFSDTHIPADAAAENAGVNMTKHFELSSQEVLDLNYRPAAMLLDGDCVYLKGLEEDYAHLTKLCDPMRKAGIPLHFNMGNHDSRENFRKAVSRKEGAGPLASHHVSIVKSRKANFFMLDSLDKTNVTPGKLGAEQLEWLAKALDAHADKPAIIYGHHNPQWVQVRGISGIVDTEEFMRTISSRLHVKAYVFGHTHHWEITEREGIHFVNLPPVAYPFNDKDPTGWVEARLLGDGIEMTLHAHKKDHPANLEMRTLKWRGV